MALQGTLDTFALPDVLHLLATTKKTGRLRLDGDRGSGTVHLDGGQVVAVEVAHAPLAAEAVDALFELLRFEDGTFAFAADAAPSPAGPALEVNDLLEGAEALLAEWREIESVVPSMDALVTLRRQLDGDSVTVAQSQWTTLVAIGSGVTVRALGDALQLSELPASRAVRDLVELGVVDLVDAPAAPPAPVAQSPTNGRAVPDLPASVDLTGSDGLAQQSPLALAPEPSPSPDHVDGATSAAVLSSAARGESPEDSSPVAVQSVPAVAADEDVLPVARPIRAHRPRPRLAEVSEQTERFVPLDLPGHEPSPASAASEQLDDLAAAFPGLAARSLSDEEDAQVSEQLASLSPEAADAVLAAVDAPDEEAREAALEDAVAGEDAPINRGLLLKFLGSAKG